ncbi:MAG: hypothetical protein H6624_04135 [Bdellovibrionaceae bacterium]|nr:hypothetical protein [Bdellovibrionales bacterium]MCB9083504.1 hypothetical protein [Pseudobdellovibrionaceae bacterium]
MYRLLIPLVLLFGCQMVQKSPHYPIPKSQLLKCQGDTSQVQVEYLRKDQDYDLVQLQTDRAKYVFGKEPWQVISSISRLILIDDKHEIRQEVIEGDLSDIMTFPEGKVYAGKIRETNPSGTLIREFSIEVKPPIQYESPHYGKMEVIPFHEKMWGGKWSSDLLLYFSKEMGTKVYFKYRSDTLERECHLAQSSGTPP